MCCFSSMKGVRVIRVAGLLLVASQFSNCGWMFKLRPAAVLPEPPPAPRAKPGAENLPKPRPDAESKPAPQPQPQPPAPTPPAKQSVPTARAVPGRPGFVFSPFNNKLIDVEGIQSGRLVADPTYPLEEKKYFRVP